MPRGVVYLINFPDGSQAALNRIALGDATVGTEIAPGWIINRIELAAAGTYTDEGLPYSFEVWVERPRAA